MDRWYINDTADTRRKPCVTNASQEQGRIETTNVIISDKRHLNVIALRCPPRPTCHTNWLRTHTCACLWSQRLVCKQPFLREYIYIYVLKNITYLFPAMRGTHCIILLLQLELFLPSNRTARSDLTLVYCILFFALSTLTRRYYIQSEMNAQGWADGEGRL